MHSDAACQGWEPFLSHLQQQKGRKSKDQAKGRLRLVDHGLHKVPAKTLLFSVGEVSEMNWASLTAHVTSDSSDIPVPQRECPWCGDPQGAAPMQALLFATVVWRWGSVDNSGYKEPQQQLQCGLGQGNGWEKPVHQEEKKKKTDRKKKINGQD